MLSHTKYGNMTRNRAGLKSKVKPYYPPSQGASNPSMTY